MDLGTDKNPDPILPAKKHRTPTTTNKDTSIKMQSVDNIPSSVSRPPYSDGNSTIWPTVGNSVVIEPASIPPHKRSKVALAKSEQPSTI